MTPVPAPTVTVPGGVAEETAAANAPEQRGESLRILMLNHNRRGTGTFFRAWHLARGLSGLGHEVTILTVSSTRRTTPSRHVEDGVTLVETPNLLDLLYGIGSGFGAIGIPYRMLLTARSRFDLIHAFDHKPNVFLPAVMGAALKGVPLVADWADWWGYTKDGSGLQEHQAWPVPRLETTMEDSIHRRADWVTTISRGLLERAVSLGIPRDRVAWIPSGAPDDLIRSEDQQTARRRLGLPENLYLLGYVGSDVGDIDLLIPFMHRLRGRHPEARLALMGPRIRSLLTGYPQAQDDVLDFGLVPFEELSQHLGVCDAFVLPMRDTVFNRTRWPNKFGDYLAAGRPILCSPVGDVADFVRTEDCGIVWHDLEGLSDAIGTLMGDREASLRMAQNARQLAEGRLSWRALVKEFLAVYASARRAA